MTEAQHPDPIWGTKADFIFGARIEDPVEGGPTTEQLWGRQVDEFSFELCCIPFFIYDLALGDVVRTTSDYELLGIVEQSKRYVFRVSFIDVAYERRLELEDELVRLGAMTEWYSPDLLALDAEDRARAQPIADLLQRRQDSIMLEYETGRQAEGD